MNPVSPAKTLSFAAILAIASAGGTALAPTHSHEPEGLPSAEDLSAMGASKGILLTHLSCERERTPAGDPKGTTSNGDEKKRKA